MAFIKISKKVLRYGFVLLALPVFFLIRYYYLNDPEVAQQGTVFAVCPFHFATGLHCPGCGSQRAIHDALHLRIGSALQHNVLFLVVVLIIAAKAYSIISKKYFSRFHYDLGGRPWFTYSLVFFVFAFWILRNLPYEPFTYLAP